MVQVAEIFAIAVFAVCVGEGGCQQKGIVLGLQMKIRAELLGRMALELSSSHLQIICSSICRLTGAAEVTKISALFRFRWGMYLL